MLRRVLVALACLTLASHAWPADPEPLSRKRFQRVEVAPTKTSIYVGSVSMTMPVFTRSGDAYHAGYTAKVFPYFFSSESGRLTVEISDEMLRTLASGTAIEFKGRAINTDGEERQVTGKATPADPLSGKLKVRVVVSKRIELIFNTTYRFLPPSPLAGP